MENTQENPVVKISTLLKENINQESVYKQALLTQGILAVAEHYNFPLNLSGSIDTGILFKSDYREDGTHNFGKELTKQLNQITVNFDDKKSKGEVSEAQFWLVIQGRNIEELIHNVADEIEA